MSARVRIAVVGPEAAGKTSLAQALAEQLGVPLLDDPRVTFLAQTGYHTLYEAARARPVWRDLLEHQLAREAGPEAAILDTPALDCWVLWQRWGWCAASPAVTDRLYASVSAAARRYTHIVLMPDRQVASGGGNRFVDAENAAQVARLTRAAVDELAGHAGQLRLEPGDASSYLAAASSLARA